MDDDFWQRLPDEFETMTYRSLYPDLVHMSDAELLDHYKRYGREEGRTANNLRDRSGFTALIPEDAAILEIGPFCNPIMRGRRVSYFDVLSREELVQRAISIGLDPAGTPNIDYTGELSTIEHRFDVVISCHSLEHQPDLVGHLVDVGRLLLPGGAYFLLVPDKRYCFDHFIPVSNLAEVIAAYHERRKIHTLRSVIEHRALITHNDSIRHWEGDHGAMFVNFGPRFQAALQEFDVANGAYIDVHTWYFTPDSASATLSELHSIGLSPLSVDRVYPSKYGTTEFWMILRA